MGKRGARRHPPGIPRASPGGGGRARGAAGDLFEKLPTIWRSALKLQHSIAAKSKPKSMEGIAKNDHMSLKMFLSRSLNQFFENCSKKGSPKSWRVLQKRPSGNSSTLVNLSQPQSMSASGASQSGVRTASRNHPSSRAGDQDDQANSLKLWNVFLPPGR